MLLFPKALFLETTSEKLLKFYFSMEFLLNIFKIFSSFPLKICIFVQTREKLKQGFKFFEKSAKIMHFCNFPIKFFENFQKFSNNFRNFRPQDPLQRRSPKMFSSMFLAAPLHIYDSNRSIVLRIFNSKC